MTPTAASRAFPPHVRKKLRQRLWRHVATILILTPIIIPFSIGALIIKAFGLAVTFLRFGNTTTPPLTPI